MGVSSPGWTLVAVPDPGRARTLDELVQVLRLLKVWAGDPSYRTITERVNAAWTAAGRPHSELARRSTVADCFRTGRRRLDADLVLAVVEALHGQVGYVAQWRQALRVIGAEVSAAAQVRVEDALPREVEEFTGRTAELTLLREVLHQAGGGDAAPVVVAIAGMAGVGKTQLAVHAGHLCTRDRGFDRILFVDLRGFHPDPAQPPADPAVVLDGFLRLLGMSGHQIPHDLPHRVVAYRDRLAASRTLVMLDNAADEEQVRPLLPGAAGCPTLITSRHQLPGLDAAIPLTLGLFTPEESLAFLGRAAAGVSHGPDPDAGLRIARRCGHLPLALGLLGAHMRTTPGWTLTDHADRLEERDHARRLDTEVELAFDVSYQRLPGKQRRLLRLAALHPGQDIDDYAAAALSDTDLTAARACLDELHRRHLLQRPAADRYSFHDLIRIHAAGRAHDEESPSARRAALDRLFGHYLSTAARAMDVLYPAETHSRPRIPPPPTPGPPLANAADARAWLNTERHTLVAVAAHTASHGWPAHTVQLSATLFRYLNGGHHADALTLHSHAADAARQTGNVAGHATALTNLGASYLWLGQYTVAADHLQRARSLFQDVGDPAGEARTLGNLGNIAVRQGRYERALGYYWRGLILYRRAGDRHGEARELGNLGFVETRLGRYEPASLHLRQALGICRETGDRNGEANVMTGLGAVQVRQGAYGPASDHLRQALAVYQQLGNRNGEANALDSLGVLYARLGMPADATMHHQRALTICQETGDRDGEIYAHNGLGEAADLAGDHAVAVAHHLTALALATDTGDREQQARAHSALARLHHAHHQHTQAYYHYQQARTLYTELGTPRATEASSAR